MTPPILIAAVDHAEDERQLAREAAEQRTARQILALNALINK